MKASPNYFDKKRIKTLKKVLMSDDWRGENLKYEYIQSVVIAKLNEGKKDFHSSENIWLRGNQYS
jgi:hypothetical protein